MSKKYLSTGDDMMDKLLYMALAIMGIFIFIFFIIPALAHGMSISY